MESIPFIEGFYGEEHGYNLQYRSTRMFARIACRFPLALIVMSASLGGAQIGSTSVIPIPTEGFAGLPGEGPSAITGAPLCADVITTRTQTLADGNRLQNKRTDHVCRDSKGRTRRETTPTVTPATEQPAVQMVGSIVIFDPSANLVINLYPVQHKAIERPTRIPIRPAGPVVPGSFPPSSGPTWQQVPKNNIHVTTRAGDDVVEENLGEDLIHGVVAKGTKITRTIPAGHMGNDLPFVIVTERWYSDDLKTVMRLKQTDPRVGETSTEVTNVVPGEPDALLFQIPADYKVEELQTAPAPNR